MLFKEAYHDHSSQYMGSRIYTFTSTSTETVGEGQIQFLDVPYVKLTLAMDSVLLNSIRKFITLEKANKKATVETRLQGLLECKQTWTKPKLTMPDFCASLSSSKS